MLLDGPTSVVGPNPGLKSSLQQHLHSGSKFSFRVIYLYIVSMVVAGLTKCYQVAILCG